MYWNDEGYLLSKNIFNENSIIIEAFTLNHGKYTGIVYGGSSRKQKKNFQLGNKIYFNWNSKGENKSGYFSTELIKPVSPLFFDDKKRVAGLISAVSILKILLPERQVNGAIYKLFERMINDLNLDNWILSYLYWEIKTIKELGFEINFKRDSIELNNKIFLIPDIFLKKNSVFSINEVKKALVFNKNLLKENFIYPNNLSFPIFRNILENYYS